MSRSERLSTGKNSDLQGIEYETYTLSRREWVLYGAEGILLAAVLDYVFYRSFLLILLIFPAGILFPLALKKKLKQRRMEKLRGLLTTESYFSQHPTLPIIPAHSLWQ